MTPTDNIFWPYLSPILETQRIENNVAYIQMSDGNGMDRMMTDSVSEDVYPGIFVYRPKYTTKKVESHLLVAEFNTSIYIWCKIEDNDRVDEEAAYSKAESIATAIIKKLQHDSLSYKNFLDFDSFHVEPILNFSVDKACGFELKFRLALGANKLFC